MNGITSMHTDGEGKTICSFKSLVSGDYDYVINMDITELILGVNRIDSGEHIQDVFPSMSADDRERFISGVTPEEWNDMYPVEDRRI